MRRSELNGWWWLGIPIVVPMVRALFRVRVEGLTNLPEGGAVLAFNHVSVLDGPVLAAEVAIRGRRELRFLVASEISDHPIFGPIMRAFEQIFIHRGAGDLHALDQAIETVRDGALAALAPEGHVADDGDPALGIGELQRIRSGVARIALPAGAPIVPVGIWGTQSRWPSSGILWDTFFSRPPLAIVIGRPLRPRTTGDNAGDIKQIREDVRATLEIQVARARALAGEP